MSADHGRGVFFLRDIFTHLRVQPDKHLMWSAGLRLSDLFAKRTGSRPPTKRGLKSDGSGGTHCFAFYPDHMWDDAVAIVSALRTRPDPQRVFEFEFPAVQHVDA